MRSLFPSLPSSLPLSLPVAVGWESPEYSVTEGSGPAQPCVTVQAAQLSRNVVVTITTASDEGITLQQFSSLNISCVCQLYCQTLSSPPSPPSFPISLSLRHTGTAGTSDYTPVSTELTFQPNDSSTLCVNVPIANDAIVENDETLRLSLEISDNTITVTSTETTVTIQDDNDGMYSYTCTLVCTEKSTSLL